MSAPILLTPGPLTTAPDTRAAMQRDWGSRDPEFVALSAAVCRALAAIANAGDELACVPLQGSGTFAVEAALATLVPRGGHVLVLHNGSYGARLVEICRRLGRACTAHASSELEPLAPAALEAALARDPTITHVALVHVETGAGVANPLAELAAVSRAHGRRVIVDAMSSFGALPIDARALACDAVIAASGKCLEGAPGMGFVIARRDALAAARDNAASLALDLADQHAELERTGQWRFTPPTHVVAALHHALQLHAAEGGQPARLARYERNCAELVAGMARLGMQPIVRAAHQAPIIVSFGVPAAPAWSFPRFYELVRARGYVVYPGKLAARDTFRVGCIGAIDASALRGAVDAIDAALDALGIPHPA